MVGWSQFNAAERRAFLVCLGVAVGYAVTLVILYVRRTWILDGDGGPALTDFIAIWSAGRLALAGHAASAYSAASEHAAEVVTLGHPFRHEYGWPYPPSYFFVAAGLALLPYALSFLAWVAGTATFYGFAVGKASGRWSAAIAALAAPWTLACALVGQNGFLTGGLMALALVCLDTSPMASGLFFGLLTYKPQFGLLIPIALAAGGRWKAIGWAMATTVALTGLSVAVFGVQAMAGFLWTLPRTAQTLVVEGGVGWNKLESIYGLARCLGGSNAVATGLQVVTSLGAAVAIALLWRSKAASALKSAGLIVAAAISTPYLFAYDLPILGVATAFLMREADLDLLDYLGLAIAWSALGFALVVPLPVGLFATLSLGSLVVRRVVMSRGESATLAPATN